MKLVRSTSQHDHNYSLWGHLKILVVHISEAVVSVREMSGIFEQVHESLHQCCQACIITGGRNFEKLL